MTFQTYRNLLFSALIGTRDLQCRRVERLTWTNTPDGFWYLCRSQIMSSLFSDWTSAISLIFGGCCTNAITLEQITSRYPASGSIVTFFQFLVISLHGLPKFLIWTRYGPRFRPRSIPLLVYFAQVILFYLVSVLNNAAFAYHIPMAVHIIFRSGGLVVTMILGWFISNKRSVGVLVLFRG